MKVFKNPLVSILIPLYNSEKYIGETIDSCLDQTWKNIEIIIVDDGSEDKSLHIVQEYSSKYDFIKLYQQSNKGAPAARNKAFELSNGRFIQYLDSDDILSEAKIENQLKLFAEYGDNIISSSKWDRFYNSLNDAVFPERPTYKDFDDPVDWILEVSSKNDMGQTSVWLTPKSIIEKAGKWNEDLTINQDGEFFTRVLLQSKSVKFCKDAYVYYRSGDRSRISYTNKNRSLSLLQSYISIEKNLLKKERSKRTKYACYLIYLRFIYENFSSDSKLIAEAKQRIYNLGFAKLKPYGGKNFKKLARLIGFENALKLRKLIKRQ
jgi:glycosyltransferase involved in cell wall biosynthesis